MAPSDYSKEQLIAAVAKEIAELGLDMLAELALAHLENGTHRENSRCVCSCTQCAALLVTLCEHGRRLEAAGSARAAVVS